MLKKIFYRIRTLFFTNICKKGIVKYKGKLFINHWSKFNNKTIIGYNCHFNGIKIMGNGNVSIGDNFHSGKNLLILTSNHNYDNGDKIPYDETTIDADVIIKDNVWIGENVTILQGITIEEGAIIQAGSVVVSNICSCAIVGGHPAKIFKKRDEEHYYRLKKEKKFF